MDSSTEKRLRKLLDSAFDCNKREKMCMGLEQNKLTLSQREKKRFYESITNLYPEISEKCSSIGNRMLPPCLAIASTNYGSPYDKFMGSFSVLDCSVWIRDELLETDFPASRLNEILSNINLEMKSENKDSAKWIDAYWNGDVTVGIAEIIRNHLSDDFIKYDVDDEKRHGKTWAFYRELMDAIPSERIEVAEEIFIDRLYAYLETQMRVVKFFLLQTKSNDDTIDALISESTHNFPMSPKDRKKASLEENSFMASQFLTNDVFNNFTSDTLDPEEKNLYITGSIVTLSSLALYILGIISDFIFSLNVDNATRDKITATVEKFEPLIMSNGDNIDPMTVMIGYLSLLDKDSDYIYLFGTVEMMMQIYNYLSLFSGGKLNVTGHCLPAWSRRSDNPYALRYQLNENSENKSDNNDDEQGNDGFKKCFISLAQSLYYFSSFLLTPRTLQKFRISDFDLAEESVDLACNVMNIKYTDDENVYTWYNKTEGIQNKDIREGLRDEETIDRNNKNEEIKEKISKLEAENKKIEAENKKLKKQLSETKSALNNSEIKREREVRKTENIEKQVEDDRHELYDLREILFNRLYEQDMEQTDEDNSDESKDDKFPYELEHRMVVFGGFDNWRASLIKLVTNVTMAPNTDIISSDLVRNADAIWFQINAISHSAYYTARDIAKNAGVPVYYFKENGVVTSANRLVDMDKEMKEKE